MTHDRAGSRETLLVVGSGYRAGHERLLAQMAADADLVLLNPEPPTWQLHRVQDCAVFDASTGGDTDDDALRAAKALLARRRVAAVVTYEETMVVTAARLARGLGLPGVPVAAPSWHATSTASAPCSPTPASPRPDPTSSTTWTRPAGPPATSATR